MFTAIKKRFEKSAFESIRSKVELKRKHQFTPLSQVQSLAILYKSKGGTLSPELIHLISTFERRGVDVDVIMVDKKKLLPAEKANDKLYHISNEEVSWYGVPKNDKILSVLQKNHDYFIDLTMAESGLCAYLALASMAKFKIGNRRYENSPYDLTIDMNIENNLPIFEEQLLTYLQRIG